MAGESDRSLKFGKSAGMWLFNDRGWDHDDNLGAPLGAPCRLSIPFGWMITCGAARCVVNAAQGSAEHRASKQQ